MALAFLSTAWFDALGERLRIDPGLFEGDRFALGQVVTELAAAPGRELAYTLAIGADRPPHLELGSVATADVVLVADFSTAQAIASGSPPGPLLAQGKVKVRGDATALIAAQDRLAAIGRALAGLAEETDFAPTAELAPRALGAPGSVRAHATGRAR